MSRNRVYRDIPLKAKIALAFCHRPTNYHQSKSVFISKISGSWEAIPKTGLEGITGVNGRIARLPAERIVSNQKHGLKGKTWRNLCSQRKRMKNEWMDDRGSTHNFEKRRSIDEDSDAAHIFWPDYGSALPISQTDSRVIVLLQKQFNPGKWSCVEP